MSFMHRLLGICPIVYPTKNIPAKHIEHALCLMKPPTQSRTVFLEYKKSVRLQMKVKPIEALRTCSQAVNSVRQVYVLLELKGGKGQVGPVQVSEEYEHPKPRQQIETAHTDNFCSIHLNSVHRYSLVFRRY
jgi:hypothetical protein